MTWVRTNLWRAQQSLGIANATLKKLVEDRVLPGDIDAPARERWIEYDDGWTAADIWMWHCSKGFDFRDPEDVTVLVKTKQRLGCSSEPWSDAVLEALVELRDGEPMIKRGAVKIFGHPQPISKAACDRYNELAGAAVRRNEVHEPVELEELIDGAPEALRVLKGSCLDPDRGILFEAPEATAMARVGAMEHGHPRWVATLAILVHPTHGGASARLPGVLATIERIAAHLGGGSFADGAAVERVMRTILRESRDGASADLEVVTSYLRLRSLISAWIDWQQPDPETEDGEFLRTLLPADLPADMKAAAWEESQRISVDALKARALNAGEVARRAGQRLLCVDGRLRQWERLTAVIDTEMVRIEAELEAGRPVAFPVRVSDTFRVVRPDGSVAPRLRQTIRMEIFAEDMLWHRTAVGSGWSRQIDTYLSADMKARSPARIAAHERGGQRAGVDGMAHRPGGDRRLFVVYAGTDPARHPDDEHHPPHMVGVYSVSALIESSNLSPEMARARRAFVTETGLPIHPRTMMGLTWWPGRAGQALPHLLLRHTGQLMLPYRQIRLLLAYGCAVARLELMSGLRIGETMQARHGSCFSNRPLKDRIVATMRGRPKGWPRDRLWVIDKITMGLIKRIKGWAIENWYADLGVLPFVAYGEPRKNREREQCPPARYLFQLHGRAADSRELNFCLQIATLGLPHAKAHDYRYAFAKLLRIRSASRRARAKALSHELGSAMVDRYGDWECGGLDDDDAVVKELQDQLTREMLEELIDAA